VLYVVSGQFHAPATLSPGKEHLVPIGKEAGWTPEPLCTQWQRGKIPVCAINQTWVIQLIA